jgi:hypothetical protein
MEMYNHIFRAVAYHHEETALLLLYSIANQRRDSGVSKSEVSNLPQSIDRTSVATTGVF